MCKEIKMNIIATIGPKTTDKWVIKELIDNGVNIHDAKYLDDLL